MRRLPEATYDDEETSAEPWFSVSPNDVFPQELPTFIFSPGPARDIFMELHADLADPLFWIETQDRIRASIQDDVFPYPVEIRFRERACASGKTGRGGGKEARSLSGS